MIDIAERKRLEEQIAFLAYHDSSPSCPTASGSGRSSNSRSLADGA